MDIKTRCKKFMDELGVPVTNFCKRIELSPSSYYDWMRDKAKLSDATEKRIDKYLKKYGF